MLPECENVLNVRVDLLKSLTTHDSDKNHNGIFVVFVILGRIKKV